MNLLLRPFEWVVSTLVCATMDVLFGKVDGPAYTSTTSCDCGGTGLVHAALGGGWRVCSCPAAEKLVGGSDPS